MARSGVRRPASYWMVQSLCFLMCCAVAAAENDGHRIDFTKMAELEVVLRDEAGNAVAGAEVMPYAMRVTEIGGHGFWNRELLGPPKTATSDEAGVAIIEYPVHVQRGPQVLTTRLVTFEVTHAEFVRKEVHFDLGPKQAEVTLKPGCEVSLSAVDSEGNPVDDFGVMMAGPYPPSTWAKGDSGGRRTRSIHEGTWQTMLVKLQEDGPTLFSGVLPLRVRSQQTVQLRNLRLTPGAKVRGTLSDNVPRPVSGYIVATSVPKPAEDSWSETNPSLSWHDWVEIGDDGSFEFTSLPRGGQVQLIGVCRGWISSTTVPDAGVFVMGQLIDVDDDDIAVELEMEPTGTLEVHVVTEDGTPFTEGQVSSWPNQKYYKGGSTVLGQRYRSTTQIKNQLIPRNERMPVVESDLVFPFHQSVGKDGVAVLTGLPLGGNRIIGGNRIMLSHDQYKFAANDEGNRGEVQFELPSPEPVRIEVTVVAERD